MAKGPLALHTHLVEILVFLVAAVIAVPLFRLAKMGAILAYLFAGIVIGPQALELIKDPATILSFSELGVVLLLFLIGLELEPKRLWKMRNHVFGLGLSQMLLTGSFFWIIGHLVGLSWATAFVAGFGLALSSTAFGLQILEEKRQLQTIHGQGSFSILLLQDLAVVPLVAMIPILAGVSSGETSWIGFAKSTAIVVAFIVVGLFLTRHIFRFIAESRVQEVFTASSLLVVIGSAILMEEAGLSMGTGAFLAGVLLANSEYRHELETSLQPFKGLLLGLFFIAVGMSLDLNILADKPQIVILLTLGFVILKMIIVYGLARFFRFPVESSRNMGATLGQGGEFAFVLFASALAIGLFDSSTAALLNASVTLSMVLTPFLFDLNQKYMRTYSEISERPFDKMSHEGSHVIIAGYGRFGQIVARFLQSQKIKFTILEHSASQVDTARKFGAKIYYGDASRKEILASAGAKDAKIFVLAIDDPASSIATAKMAKTHYPHLEIIARVRNRQHAIDLMALGIKNLHRETYLTSLEVAKEVLISLGSSREEINPKLAKFRTHDEGVLHRQFELRNDEKQMISYTAQANKELEAILSEDNKR